MICRKCRENIPEGSRYCNRCGAKQDVSHKPKSRGNGTGSVYQLPNKSWIAIRVLGYSAGEDGKTHRVTRSKSGFRTKKEALEYLPQLAKERPKVSPTLQKLYETWLPTHQATQSTLNCYKAAYKYFAPLQYVKLSDITIDDLQECLDDCPKGKRTMQNMRTLCGLLYKYAVPRGLASLNLGEYLRVRGGDEGHKDALPADALQAIQAHVGSVPGADYVLCQCYLGFRPSELLALDAKDYDPQERAFTGGAKTEAGKNRVVTVSPKIQPIIDRLVRGKTQGPVFCAPGGGRMGIAAYRRLFYSTLEECGVENPTEEKDGVSRRKYTPHSCRHTFATLMKNAPGSDKDKLELMGHTSTEMLRHYQDVSLEDLRKITDAL